MTLRTVQHLKPEPLGRVLSRVQSLVHQCREYVNRPNPCSCQVIGPDPCRYQAIFTPFGCSLGNFITTLLHQLVSFIPRCRGAETNRGRHQESSRGNDPREFYSALLWTPILGSGFRLCLNGLDLATYPGTFHVQLIQQYWANLQ